MAELPDYSRRFWQGSHDHRGTPEQPGRVVTLIEEPGARCKGMAYLIDTEVVQEVFEHLDYREKNGYERFDVTLSFADGEHPGLVYIAPPGNFAYLGDAPIDQIARQIASSTGPSGRNSDYLLELARALRNIQSEDEHIFALEQHLKTLLP